MSDDEGEGLLRLARLRTRLLFRFQCRVRIGLCLELGFIFSVRDSVRFRVWVIAQYG